MIVEEKLVHLKIRDKWGFNEKVFPEIENEILNLKPYYYCFLSPNSFNIFLDEEYNCNLIDSFVNTIKDICTINADYLEETTLSKTKSVYKCKKNIWGKIIKLPLGSNDIFRKENVVWRI